jgi:hypothetical protein
MPCGGSRVDATDGVLPVGVPRSVGAGGGPNRVAGAEGGARLPGSAPAPAFADISVDRVLDYLEKSDA